MFKRFIFPICVCLLFSCSKNKEVTSPEIGVLVNEDGLIHMRVQGIVNPEHPLKGALVKVGGITTTTSTTTDEEGRFYLDDVTANPYGVVITVTADGYLPARSTFILPTWDYIFVQYTEINLVTGNPVKTFDATKGGDVTMEDATAIHFSADQVFKMDSTAYTGIVTVGYQTPEKTADFRGFVTRTRRTVGLSIWSYQSLSLKGADGELLYTDKNFTVTTPAPAGAPAKVSIWHPVSYEDSDVWYDDGIATNTGNQFTFTAKNTDIILADPYTYATVQGTMMDTITGVHWDNKKITITLADKRKIIGYTNNGGQFAVRIPANQDATLFMSYKDCSGIVNTLPVTVKANPSSIDMDTIQVKADHYLHISGKVTTCENELVTGGIVHVVANNIHYRFPITGGHYNAVIQNCVTPSEVMLSATDAENHVTTPFKTIPVTQDIVSQNIQACIL